MMDDETIRRIRGALELTRDAVDGAAVAIGRAHDDIARVPYRILARVSPIAPAVRAVERAHTHATKGVCRALRAINHGTAAVAISVLDLVRARSTDGAVEGRPTSR